MSTTKNEDVVWEDEAPLAPATTSADDVQWEDENSLGGLVADVTGQQTNEVGNTVIVPKDGEKFSDTMARAAAQGKKTTPAEVNKEVSTMPKKVATVLAAAPAMGVAGTAALSAPGGLPGAIEMLENAAKAHPFIAHIITRGIEGLGIGGGISAVKKMLQ
jgi:hypothetical protein